MEQQNFTIIRDLIGCRSESGGTSLVTYYLPANSNLWLACQRLSNEISLAGNIKSKSVRKDVVIALKSGLDRLRALGPKKLEYGITLCSGSIKSYV